jgi:hypothetical protein
MKLKSFFSAAIIFCTAFFLQSCEFNCSVGKKEEEVKGVAVVKDGARIYNNIELNSLGIKVNKAYLLTEDGGRVPDDNFVDFKSPVKMQLKIDEGWVEKEGKVLLGASEKIVAEDGTVVLEEDDLFERYTEGIPAEDAKSIYLSATLRLKEGAAPTSFKVTFRVWDKNGDGYIEGSYKLFSK